MKIYYTLIMLNIAYMFEFRRNKIYQIPSLKSSMHGRLILYDICLSTRTIPLQYPPSYTTSVSGGIRNFIESGQNFNHKFTCDIIFK